MTEIYDVNWYIERKLVMEIHTSERKSFRACRRRWDWIFRNSYYPHVTAKPLEFGVAYHKGMEIYYNPDTWNLPGEVKQNLAILAFIKECENQRKVALEEQGNFFLDPQIEEDYNQRVELGKGMMEYYFAKVAPKEDIGWKPVKVEIAFMVPIKNPDTGEDVIWCKCIECFIKWDAWMIKKNPLYAEGKKFDENGILQDVGFDGLPVVYAGRLDMLAEDKYGNYWIFDWKTAAALSDNKEFLYLDDQVGSYPWALRKLNLPIRGFVYHEQRKGFPVPPKENKSRRLGCLFSVAKTQDVDYETYLRTVSTQDTEAWAAGHYDAMLTFLKEEGIVYYTRTQIPKTDNELAEIEINIGNEAMDMINPNVRVYPASSKFGCRNCAFQVPCLEKNNRGDFEYALDTMFEKREHYYVRAEASTESKGGE